MVVQPYKCSTDIIETPVEESFASMETELQPSRCRSEISKAHGMETGILSYQKMVTNDESEEQDESQREIAELKATLASMMIATKQKQTSCDQGMQTEGPPLGSIDLPSAFRWRRTLNQNACTSWNKTQQNYFMPPPTRPPPFHRLQYVDSARFPLPGRVYNEKLPMQCRPYRPPHQLAGEDPSSNLNYIKGEKTVRSMSPSDMESNTKRVRFGDTHTLYY